MQFSINGKNIQNNVIYKKSTDDNTVQNPVNGQQIKKTSENSTKKAVYISTVAALAALGIYFTVRGKYKNVLKKVTKTITSKPAAQTSNSKLNQTNTGNINNTQNSNSTISTSNTQIPSKPKQTGANSKTNVSKPVTNPAINPSVIKTQADTFINGFLKGQNKLLERIVLTHNFSQYGKKGIPLKYTREQLVQDINDAVKNLSEKRQEEVLNQFNLTKSRFDIDGIPVLNRQTDNSPESQKIKSLIEKFYYKNETTFADSAAKQAFDEIIKGFPEFNMIIGKVQHGTHIYSVDIHSLNVLQKAMNNPSYASLSDEGKEILKLTSLIHDFGKKGKVITTGHAAISKKEAEMFLDSYNLSPEVKQRVLNHVENHHWFESFNKGLFDERDVRNIFKTPEDLEIAKILAKADFECVNPSFHLYMMNPSKMLTQAEFDAEFALKTAKIGGKNIVKNTGRSLQEQIQHLEKNYKKETVYTDLNIRNGNAQGMPVEKYSKDGHKDFWLKINDELYYIPENHSFVLNQYADEAYNIINGSNIRSAQEIGHISNRPVVMGFDEKVYGYKYLSADSNIADNPQLIYEGFGIDCLLSTPVNSKNIIVSNGKAIRLQNGLQQYVWGKLLAPTPSKLFTENVSEISAAFKEGTESALLLKDMTRNDLIKSLEKTERIADAVCPKYCGNDNNFRFITETINTRKKYIKEFCNKLKNNPQLPDETMAEYTERIDAMMPKPKTYTAPINDHLTKTLSKEEKEIIETNWREFQKLSGQKIMHNATDVMEKDSLIHNAPLVNLESILDKGLVSGQVEIGKKVMGSSVGGNTTSTPGQFDTFKVLKDEKIKDYFILSNRSKYEENWLPTSVKDHVITFVIDNKCLPEKIKQSLQFYGNKIQNPTHYTIPFGVPSNTIEKIIVSNKLQPQQIENIKEQIAMRNLDIKVFDIDGRLL